VALRPDRALSTLLAAAALALGAAACGPADSPLSGDAGALDAATDGPALDASPDGRDAGDEGGWDAGSEADAGTTRTDAGQPPVDAGQPRVDAGPPPAPPRAFSARFRVGSFNVPETRRASLLTSREARANAVLNLIRDNDIVATSVQESGTYLKAAVADRDAWRSTWGRVNKFVNGRQVGNGIVFRRAPLRLIDSHDIRVPMPSRPRGLNIPVRLFEHQSDDGARARFVMISFHAPTRRDDPTDASRRALRMALSRYIDRCHRQGLVVVLAGDANDGAYASHFRPEMKTAYHHVVDWILVSRAIQVHHGFSRNRPALSDHELIAAGISIPVDPSAPRTLPD
jgi:hypothetical protein